MYISTYYDDYLVLEGEFSVECNFYDSTIVVVSPKEKLKDIYSFCGIKNENGKIYKLDLCCEDRSVVQDIDSSNPDYDFITFKLEKNKSIFKEFSDLIKESSFNSKFKLLFSKLEEAE